MVLGIVYPRNRLTVVFCVELVVPHFITSYN